MSDFADKRVLITGGLGFIGSNLAIRLVELGSEVTLLDAMIPGHGGNLFNIEPIKDDVVVNFSDIRDEHSMNYIVRGKDYVFHLAGQNDHVLSQTDPYPDIDINVKGSVVLLEACRKLTDVRLVYTGTRGEYGSWPSCLPGEDTPINPKGIYELSSLTAQKVFKIYHDNQGIRSVTLRLTNIYGERAQMQHSRFGVANWFIRLAIDGQPIQVFGDGKIVRDFVYVQDCVDAICACAGADDAYGEVLNVGDDAPSSFLQLAETVVEEAGAGSWRLAPFLSPERAAQEPATSAPISPRSAGWPAGGRRPRFAKGSGERSTTTAPAKRTTGDGEHWPMKVPFGDLRRERSECGARVRAGIDRVLESGWFVLGKELEGFEEAFSAYLGDVHVVGVGSGTEALHLALMAAGVEPGDFVVTVPNTAVPTVSAISAAGATPLLVDVDDVGLTMDRAAPATTGAREAEAGPTLEGRGARAPLRPDCGHGSDREGREGLRPRGHRGRGPGTRRGLRRKKSRHHRRLWRLQLLSKQEPRLLR